MKLIKLSVVFFLATVTLMSCDNYGKKATKGPVEVYYKDGITEADAQHAANLFAWIDSMQNNNTTAKKSFQLFKQNDVISLKMVAEKEKLAAVNESAFYLIGNMVADSVFNGKPVNVELTNNKFETFKTYPYKKIDIDIMTAPEN